uniref:Uncharacterized protein n=1 Tax=Arundo donax TaxID=35708 RepID=A0A0A9CP78_ARUDO
MNKLLVDHHLERSLLDIGSNFLTLMISFKRH